MQLAEATRYVLTNASRELIPRVPSAGLFQCIDGRSRRTPDEMLTKGEFIPAAIAFPAGALGFPLTALATINDRLLNPLRGTRLHAPAVKAFDFTRAMKFAEQYFGGMSWHTDEKHLHDPLACAGCGHATALLGKDDYGLGEVYRGEFKIYAEKLGKRAKKAEPGMTAFCYSGEHLERAVIRIQCNRTSGRYVSLRPNDGVVSAFVTNEVMGIRYLTHFAGSLFGEFRQEFEGDLGVTRAEFIDHIRSTYHTHLRISANQLAGDYPVFEVNDEGEGDLHVDPSGMKFHKL